VYIYTIYFYNRRPNNYRTIIRRTQHQFHCEIGSARQFQRMPVCTYLYINMSTAVRLHYLDQGERSSSWSLTRAPLPRETLPPSVITVLKYNNILHTLPRGDFLHRELRHFRTRRRRTNGFFFLNCIYLCSCSDFITRPLPTPFAFLHKPENYNDNNNAIYNIYLCVIRCATQCGWPRMTPINR